MLLGSLIGDRGGELIKQALSIDFLVFRFTQPISLILRFDHF